MSTNLKTPESLPDEHSPARHTPGPPAPAKPKKRGLLWVVLLLAIAAVAGYAVYHAGDPIPVANKGGGGGGKGGGGRGNPIGPVPVVVTKVGRSSIPVRINGLGNVSPFYTVSVKARVDGQLMKVGF